VIFVNFATAAFNQTLACRAKQNDCNLADAKVRSNALVMEEKLKKKESVPITS